MSSKLKLVIHNFYFEGECSLFPVCVALFPIFTSARLVVDECSGQRLAFKLCMTVALCQQPKL